MGVNIANSYDESAEASAGFDPVPFDDYRAKIIEADVEDVSKNNSYGKCLKLTWQIETGPYDGRLVWQRLNLWAEGMKNIDKVISIANSQFASIREATGKLTPQDTDELLHIPCMIKVAIKTDPSGQYGPQNEIKSVKPVGGAASQAPQQRSAPSNANSAPANQAPARQAAGGGSAPWRR
jgi:hypothetical protein